MGLRQARLDEIGPDYVLSVQRDRDGVESVVMYGLRKSGSGSR